MKVEERVANIRDLDFINSCILYGARKGHYSFDAENPAVVNSMKKEIKSVISNQALLDQRSAQATVYTLNNNRLATLILSEAVTNSNSLEIYAFSVVKKYQDRGYGSQILDTVLNRLVYTDVYARCSLVSVKMYNLLECRGFSFYTVDRDHRILYREAIDRSDINDLLAMSNPGQYSGANAE